MRRRTFLQSIGLGLCSAFVGIWPDLAPRPSTEYAGLLHEDFIRAWHSLTQYRDIEGRLIWEDTGEDFGADFRTARPERWTA